MRHILEKAGSEWEKTVLAGCFVLAVMLLVVGVMRRASGRSSVSRQAPPAQRPVLGEGAFAFLGEAPEVDADRRSPFLFETTVKPSKPVRRRRPKPPKPKPRKVEPKPEPKLEPKPEPKVEAPKPKPVRTPKPAIKYVRRALQFVYSTPTTSGKRKAFVKVQGKPALVNAGDEVAGIRIVRFTEDTLYVVDGRGKMRRVAFGQTEQITVVVK